MTLADAVRRRCTESWFRVLEATVYRRLYLTESRHSVRTEDDPTRGFRREIVVPKNGPFTICVDGLEIDIADLDPIADLHELREALPPARIRRDPADRLARGEGCLIARHDEKIIGVCWFAHGQPVCIPYLRWELPLAPNELYEGGIYIHPDYRGRGLLHAISHACRKRVVLLAADAGVAKEQLNFMFLTEPRNEISLRSTYRRGGRVSEKIVRVGIGRWGRVYRRPASWSPPD